MIYFHIRIKQSHPPETKRLTDSPVVPCRPVSSLDCGRTAGAQLSALTPG
jgi:hypothetical protein